MRVQNRLQQLINQWESKNGQKLQVSQLARAAGVSDDYIRKMIRGERVGSYRVLLSLAEFFDCHVDDLICAQK